MSPLSNRKAELDPVNCSAVKIDNFGFGNLEVNVAILHIFMIKKLINAPGLSLEHQDA